MHSLVIETVTKRYGTTLALDEVSFVVDPGEFVALLGPSGAGKSTLFRCVTRLVAPDTGVVRVLGRDMSALGGQELRLARRDVGLIFQQFNLIGRLSAMDNVLAGRMGHASTLRVMLRQFTRADRQLALAALDRVGLLERAGQRADSLSGGQQQRVAIARALCLTPKIMLFDEPTSALDPEMIKEVLDVMIELTSQGMTMLCVTHEMGFAKAVADRVIFMDQGQVVEQAPPQQFFDAPQTDRAQDFLSKILGH